MLHHVAHFSRFFHVTIIGIQSPASVWIKWDVKAFHRNNIIGFGFALDFLFSMNFHCGSILTLPLRMHTQDEKASPAR
jgi:hypothetical protein